MRATAGLLASAASAVVVLAPVVVRPGYALTYDMVFAPRPPLDGGLLGLGSGVARAVPSDLLVALLSHVVPGAVVQRLVLAAVLVLGGWGAARLVPSGRPLAAVVTALAWTWTPGTYERLVLGQWALLVSLAALPWAVAGATRLRQDGRARPLLVALVAAGCGSPAGGLLVALTALVVVLWPGGRRRLLGTGLALLVVLPWALPSLLRPGGVPGDAAGLAAFAPRADTALGTVGSVLTLGGVWNADVAPPGRELVLTALLSLLLVVAAVAGLVRSRPAWLAPLGAVAVVGLLAGLAPGVPGLDAVARAVVAHVPGGALLRDGQKLAAPWALLVAVGLGAAADLVADRVAEVGARRLLAGVLVVLPVATVPALAWGAAGRLHPVRYPSDWTSLASHVRGSGRVLALPYSTYRAPAWNDRRTVLDPLPRFVGARALVDDDLVLADRTVRGEDPAAADVAAALQGATPLPDALAGQGVGWVVVEKGEPGAGEVTQRLVGATEVSDGAVLSVWRLMGVRHVARPAPPDAPVVVGDLLAVALLLAAGARRDRIR